MLKHGKSKEHSRGDNLEESIKATATAGHVSAPRRLMKTGIILLILVTITGGVYVYFSHFATARYKVGNYSFNDKDVNALAAALAKNGPADTVTKDAKDRLILLNALKTEADKRGITYTPDEVDVFLKPTYEKHGDKEKYLLYMQSQYGWSSNDVLTHQTSEYLKSKLENDLISKRDYVLVFARWDSMNVFQKDKAKDIYGRRLEVLTKHFLPLFERRATNEEISRLADVTDDMNSDDRNRAFMVQQGVPIYFKQWPHEQPMSFPASMAHNEGEDINTKLKSLKAVGDFFGPVKANNGMLLIARLDKLSGGKFVDWDDFAASYTNNDGQ